tara:strand:+ start:238 stop:663 length:426 start_codon:yes stop_codon:yes gene_type:complete
MSWKDIIKIQTLVPKEEEVEVELDTDALAESCCGQAKLDYIVAMTEKFQEDLDEQIDKVSERIKRYPAGPKKTEAERLFTQLQQNQNQIHSMVETYQNIIDDVDCDEFRQYLIQMSRDSTDPMQEPSKTILADWKKCEGEE